MVFYVNSSVKQVARASESCDQEFNVALRKNYRKIIALIFPLETADFCEIIDGIIARVPYISCSIAAYKKTIVVSIKQ